MVLSRFSGPPRTAEVAHERKLDRADTVEEFRKRLVPGVILQPSGVYATMRAQEIGCVFMRST